MPPLVNVSRRSRLSGAPEAELLQAVLDRASITQWDVLIVGDGSGSGWDSACGWACVLVDRATRGRRLFYGAMNAGSVNFAETMPYLQALNWYDQHGGGKARLKEQGFLRVHIITDSQVIARWGTEALNGALPRKHIVMWAGLKEFRRLGYCIDFHWANRSTSLLNWASDLIAGMARREMQRSMDPKVGDGVLAVRAANALASVKFEDPRSGEPISPYHLNHDEE